MNLSKECEYCGNIFSAQRGTAKYCSDSCKTLAYRKRRTIEEEKIKQEEAENELANYLNKTLDVMREKIESDLKTQQQSIELQIQMEQERNRQKQIEQEMKNKKLKEQRAIDSAIARKKFEQKTKWIQFIGLSIIDILTNVSKKNG